MANVIFSKNLDVEEKLTLMKEDAQFEVGADNDAERTALLCAGKIKGRAAPPKIPKLYLASHCIFNCAYCGCRCSREERSNYCNTPAELAQMAVSEAERNGHGVFITSSIYKSADYTQELLAETARIIREELNYGGFLHAKVMPGADPLLIARTGSYANRLSVNIEVAQSSGYERIAKQKNKTNILTPMRDISRQIMDARDIRRPFATSQTTQLMAGSTQETDRTILTLSKALYRNFHLKRVYYTAFCYRNKAKGYEELPITHTPYWRMARLYQADRLMQLYGFTPEDITPEGDPNLQEKIDPKAAWALRHLDLYPVEVNTADYETLIRVPGIGLTYAKRIIEARRHCTLTHDILRKMRIALKRCAIFITCDGKYIAGHALESLRLPNLLQDDPMEISIFHSLTEGDDSGDLSAGAY